MVVLVGAVPGGVAVVELCAAVVAVDEDIGHKHCGDAAAADSIVARVPTEGGEGRPRLPLLPQGITILPGKLKPSCAQGERVPMQIFGTTQSSPGPLGVSVACAAGAGTEGCNTARGSCTIADGSPLLALQFPWQSLFPEAAAGAVPIYPYGVPTEQPGEAGGPHRRLSSTGHEERPRP